MDGENRHLTWALGILTAAVITITAYLVVFHRSGLGAWHFAPAITMLGVMASWPWINGRRSAKHFRTCHECGVQWQPTLDGHPCPACRETPTN